MKKKTYILPTTEIYLLSADELMQQEVVRLSPAQTVTGGELNTNQMGMEEEDFSIPQIPNVWED